MKPNAMKPISLFLFFLCLPLAYSNSGIFRIDLPVLSLLDHEQFLDKRDQKTYGVLKIGSQKWMTDNMAFQTPKSLCYKRKKVNCEEQGRLYPFDEIGMVCPAGWRVPNLEDWQLLKAQFSEQAILDLLDTVGWEKSTLHRNKAGLNLQGSGIQIAKRGFIGKGTATTIWLDQMNDYAEYYHAHLYGGDGTYFAATDFQTHEVLHAHPIENIENRKFSIRCICDQK